MMNKGASRGVIASGLVRDFSTTSSYSQSLTSFFTIILSPPQPSQASIVFLTLLSIFLLQFHLSTQCLISRALSGVSALSLHPPLLHVYSPFFLHVSSISSSVLISLSLLLLVSLQAPCQQNSLLKSHD